MLKVSKLCSFRQHINQTPVGRKVQYTAGGHLSESLSKITGQECCELVIRALTEQMYTQLIKITFPLLSLTDPQTNQLLPGSFFTRILAIFSLHLRASSHFPSSM